MYHNIVIMSIDVLLRSTELFIRRVLGLTGRKNYCGVFYPQFSQVKDILSKGEHRAPFSVITYSYLPHLRTYLVSLTPTVVSIIHPSSLLYYAPVSSTCKAENFILKPRVDLAAFLQDQ